MVQRCPAIAARSRHVMLCGCSSAAGRNYSWTDASPSSWCWRRSSWPTSRSYSIFFAPPPSRRPKSRRPRPSRRQASQKPTPPKPDEAGAKREAEARPPTEAAIEAAPEQSRPTPEQTAPKRPRTRQSSRTGARSVRSMPHSRYRMLVTWTNRGAAIERHRAQQPPLSRPGRPQRISGPAGAGRCAEQGRRAGARRRPGTPAGRARPEAGDVITAIGTQKIISADGLDRRRWLKTEARRQDRHRRSSAATTRSN